VLNANGARRRAYFNNALDISSNGDNIKEFYVRAKNMTKESGIPHEVDHIVPISKGGKHHESNLQILTQTENRRKHNKYDQKTSNKTAS
jgi:5-methylcytosine-specific restriction endonuclease McrA